MVNPPRPRNRAEFTGAAAISVQVGAAEPKVELPELLIWGSCTLGSLRRKPDPENMMKPLPTALICLACSFAAAALAYVLFDANHKPLPAAQAPEDAAATARIEQLETDFSSLN
jgi:hypothetical protein